MTIFQINNFVKTKDPNHTVFVWSIHIYTYEQTNTNIPTHTMSNGKMQYVVFRLNYTKDI